MEDRDAQLEQLGRNLTILWRQLELAKRRGDWQTYWKLRRSWLATGRLFSVLTEQAMTQREAQLTLVPDDFGRHHDVGA